MWPAASSVRRQIYNFIGDKPFSIRDFLNYGSRAAIDQIFYRLVRQGIIVRIAQGLYIKEGAPMPSIQEVATLKATSFNKSIAIHGLEAARVLGIDAPETGLRPAPFMTNILQIIKRNIEINQNPIFAVNGKTSSFVYQSKTIRLIGINSRQIALGDDPIGLTIRALAYMGKRVCDAYVVSCALRSFSWSDRNKFRESVRYMYAWIHKCYKNIANPYSANHGYVML